MDSSDGKLLDWILADKISLLKEQIQDIKNEIGLRKQLAQKAIAETDDQICKVRTLIYELDACGALQGKKTDLERQVQNLELEKQNQKIRCWNDIEGLKRELRQVRKEYRDAVRRASVAGVSAE